MVIFSLYKNKKVQLLVRAEGYLQFLWNNFLSQISFNTISAAFWCTRLGYGWYLPCAEEMHYLLSIANNGDGKNGLISRSLRKHRGEKISEKWYWTSSEYGKKEAINVSASGRVSTEKKGEVLAVRAIRAF